MPEPMETNTKLGNSLPCPCSRSASAAASVSFSTARFSPNARRSPARTSGLSQPAIPPVSVIASRFGSYTPGLPSTVCVTSSLAIPAAAQMPSASLISSLTRLRTLAALHADSALALISPVRSVTAPRRYS